MPIYAYRCESCGFAKDVLQKMSDAPLTQCPQCGADAFRKQVTAAGFQLKGSGWYVTDFRGGAKPGASKDGDGKNGADQGAAGGAAEAAKKAPADAATPKSGDTAAAAPAKASGAAAQSKPGKSAAGGT